MPYRNTGDLRRWHVLEAVYADLRGSAAIVLQPTMATVNNKEQKAKVGLLVPVVVL